jgi:hypothetical protein
MLSADLGPLATARNFLTRKSALDYSPAEILSQISAILQFDLLSIENM